MRAFGNYLIILLYFLIGGIPAHAVEVRLPLSSITKWEVISSSTLVAYTNESPKAFVELGFNCPSLSIGQDFRLRSFSPSLENGDTVIVNGQKCMIISVKLIREN